MTPIHLTWLNGPDIEKLAMTDDEIIAAVETGLLAQGRGETVIEPRMHLVPDPAFNGHFNVLRGYIAPLKLAGVKIVGDFVDNYKRGLPSEMALLNLFDPTTGMPVAILDATAITDMRTGALTAARRQVSRALGTRAFSAMSARGVPPIGTSASSTVSSSSRRSACIRGARRAATPSPRDSTADLGKSVIAVDSWQACLEGADIMVEASRLDRPEPLFKTAWVKKGALVIPYGTMSAVELSLTDIMDKMVMDDWGQAGAGKFGALRAHVEAGKLSEATLYAELCEIAVGKKPGRERDDETILFWHRGLSLSDIALGHAMLEKARQQGIGQQLRFS